MKLNLFKCLLGLSLILFVSCKGKDSDPIGPSTKPYIQLSSVIYKTTGQSGLRKFNITSNRPWKVELTDEQKSWITVTPESSEEAKVQVTVTVTKNVDIAKRSTDIKFFIEEDPSVNSLFKISQGTEYMFLKDSLALIDFYNSTNGEQWTTKWNINEPVAKWGYYYTSPDTNRKTWEGVYVNLDADNSRRVTSLAWVKDNNMSGAITDSFKNLSALNSLYLAGFRSDENFNFASLVSILKNFEDFAHLWLVDNCTFNGSRLGNELGDLKKLKALNIDKHDFVGFTEDFGSFRLDSLDGFTISNGNFKSTLEKKYFEFMPRVVVISLYNNKFEGEIPDNFTAGKPRLLAIELMGNCLTGVFPSTIKNSPIFNNSDGSEMICPQNPDCGGGFSSGCD